MNSPNTTNKCLDNSVGVVFVTHFARHHLPRCLPPILNSPLKPRVLVMNSSSQDGTVPLAEEMGAETLVIPRNAFNHGLSREKARRHLGTDIIVMMTPDAYAVGNGMLENLIKPLLRKKASISYARQIPHDGADFFESFLRTFNYPKQNQIRCFDDRNKYGIYTIFCSNSCAAYLSSALDEIGGFPDVLIGEDTFAAARLLIKGHRIAYAKDAVVKHSHRYSLLQEFRRHFDTGLCRQMNRDLLKDFGSDEKRGAQYVKQMLKIIFKKKPGYLPYALLQTGVKYAGYMMGKYSSKAPLSVKKLLSGQDFYWSE